MYLINRVTKKMTKLAIFRIFVIRNFLFYGRSKEVQQRNRKRKF